MAQNSGHTNYIVDEWVDVEHCVHAALMDAPENLTTHRIAHLVARIAATLIERKILTTEELEGFLLTARG